MFKFDCPGKRLLIAILLLLAPALASAGDITFIWQPSNDNVLGYRLYNGDHNVVVDAIPADQHTVTTTAPDKCTSYYLTAYNDEVESDPSTIAAYCPPPPTLAVPGKFIITVEAVGGTQ